MHSESSRCWRDHDVTVLFGQRHGHPEGHAAGDDRDLVQRIGLVENVGEQGVATLVEGNSLALVVLKNHRVALLAHQDAVARGLEVLHANGGRVATYRVQRGLVDEVRQVRSAHARRTASDD